MKFIGKTLSMAFGVAALSSAALATSYQEFTQSFVPDFESQALGTAESVGWTEYDSRCLLTNPLGGGCITMERSRAEGSIQITKTELQSGHIYHTRTDDDPIWGPGKSGLTSNLYFEFRYEGSTAAEKYEQDVLVDHPWGDLHPGGRIQVWLTGCPGTQYQIFFKYVADPGHDDQPNWFLVNNVSPKIQNRLADSARRLLGLDELAIVTSGNVEDKCRMN